MNKAHKLFFEFLPKYDIWHFNYSQTLFFYPLNILLLKLYGKKIVVTFRGSDVETNLDFTKTNPVIKAHKKDWPSYFKNFHHLTVTINKVYNHRLLAKQQFLLLQRLNFQTNKLDIRFHFLKQADTPSR